MRKLFITERLADCNERFKLMFIEAREISFLLE